MCCNSDPLTRNCAGKSPPYTRKKMRMVTVTRELEHRTTSKTCGFYYQVYKGNNLT